MRCAQNMPSEQLEDIGVEGFEAGRADCPPAVETQAVTAAGLGIVFVQYDFSLEGPGRKSQGFECREQARMMRRRRFVAGAQPVAASDLA